MVAKADLSTRDLLARHANSVHKTQDLGPSLFRLINIDASSFNNKRDFSTEGPFNVAGTTQEFDNEAAFMATPLTGRTDEILHSLSSQNDEGTTTSALTTDAADYSSPDIDNVSMFNFDIDQFMVFSPYPFGDDEPLASMNQGSATAAASPKVAGLQYPRTSKCSFDCLIGVNDMSICRSTERTLYWKFTDDEWNAFVTRTSHLYSDTETRLPSRQSLSRYMAAYFRSYHEHLPFLHASTINLQDTEAHLILAIAAIGAQYCLEAKNMVSLFTIAKSIILQRIDRRKKTGIGRAMRSSQTVTHGQAESENGGDRIQVCQTLLLLMVAATWGDDNSLLNEDMELQGITANYIREQKLLSIHEPGDTSWRAWIQAEGARRTILIAFCFFNFHTILYNVPPPVLNSEINMVLPCYEEEWRCDTAISWEQARTKTITNPQFGSAFKSLFHAEQAVALPACSSLGVYILISALIQHIYFVRQLSQHTTHPEDTTLHSQMDILRQALSQWQQIWEMDPYRSIAPHDPNGPLPFNSIAQFRMAYIRLSIDIGSFFTMDSGDPQQIAFEMLCSPSVPRNQHSTRAALHAAHTLSAPVRMGVKLVARTQALTWSLQHSLSYLESAFLLSKWLDTITRSPCGVSLDEDEQQVLSYVRDILDEAEVVDQAIACRDLHLGVRVVSVWANLLREEGIWPIVAMVGKILTSYGDLLARRLSSDIF
jgi:hypothetical protein